MKLHLLHQLFGQWQNLVFGTKHMVNSDTAGDLLKVAKFDFQRQGPALEVVLLDAPDQFQNRVIQMDDDSGILADV